MGARAVSYSAVSKATVIPNRLATSELLWSVSRPSTLLPPASSGRPQSRRRATTSPLIGNSLTDTYVVAEAHDGSEIAEGVVVDGQRDEDGA